MKHTLKRPLNALAAALAATLQLTVHAAVPLAWEARPGNPAPAQFTRYHGETLALRCTLAGFDGDLSAQGDVRLWFQTNGMGRLWWSAPATAASNRIEATFGAAEDVGADRVSLFLGSPSNVYASAVLRLMPSPGFTPANLSLPVLKLDFDSLAVTNAPYYTKAEVDDATYELSQQIVDLYDYTNEKLDGKPNAADVPAKADVAAAANDATNYTDRAIPPAVSNIVTKGYVESLGIESGLQEETDPIWSAEKSGYATVDALGEVGDAARTAQGAANALSNRVSALETWAVGDETALSVTDAGTTNAALSITYTNRVMYSSAAERTNTVNEANAYTDRKVAGVVSAVDAALATKANRAWGETTSGGAPSPADTLYVEKSKLTITGGGNYAYLASTNGGYWAMSVSLGGVWTLQALADAQNPTNPATASFIDADGNTAWTVTSTGTREAFAVQGEQYIYVEQVGGNDVVTLTYPITSDAPPTCLYAPDCTNEDAFAEASYSNWPDYIAAVDWSGHSGEWVCRVTMDGRPGRGFFRAKYIKEGTTYTSYPKPIGLSTVVIGGSVYGMHVETMNGKKVIVLEDL